MSSLLTHLASGRAEFHAVMVAAVVTGSVLAVSAGDLGPFAPILIALGICAVLFGLTGEALFFAGRCASWALNRRAPTRGEG